MFYEEKLVQCIWCYRTNPNGMFIPMSSSMLTEKITELKEQSKEITFRNIEEVVKKFTDQFDGDPEVALCFRPNASTLEEQFSFELINEFEELYFALDVSDVDRPINDVLELGNKSLSYPWKCKNNP